MSVPQKKPLTLEERARILCLMREKDKVVTGALNGYIVDAIYNACAHQAIIEAEEEGEVDIESMNLAEYARRMQGSFVNLSEMLRVQLTERAAKIRKDKIDAPIRKAIFEIQQLITHAMQHMDLKEHHLLNATMTELYPKLKSVRDSINRDHMKAWRMLCEYCENENVRCWINPSTLIPKSSEEVSKKADEANLKAISKALRS